LNCAAIPFDLLESELFGHERGAFTEPSRKRLAVFELATKARSSLTKWAIFRRIAAQTAACLQEQEFERLGSTRTHQVDVRLVAATNRNLVDMVKRNEFRSDSTTV